MDGANPNAGLVATSVGKLYGTTVYGGQLNQSGTFFEITPGTRWTETGLYTFPGGNAGSNPYDAGRLIMDSSGNFYGTTYEGGAHQQGTVFEISISGGIAKETVLYSFDASSFNMDGDYPYAGLIMDAKGNLYGTTSKGGGSSGYGTVFELSPPVPPSTTWTATVLYVFKGSPDGNDPYGGLIMEPNGNLYGTTVSGGLHNIGTVYELSRSGSGWIETILHSFGAGGDGYEPYAPLLLAKNGDLYGTTKYGGAHSFGTAYKLSYLGLSWVETVLYSFKGSVNGPDGCYPFASLIMDAGGNLYGTTYLGGAHGLGTVFELSP